MQQRKDRKEEAAIARANAMLDEMMRDRHYSIRRSSKSKR
jgi:hypothetical protein